MKAFLGAFCAVLIAAGGFYFLTSKQRTEEAAKATGVAIAQELERAALQKELAVAIPRAEKALADAEEIVSLDGEDLSAPAADSIQKIHKRDVEMAKVRLENLRTKMVAASR